MGRHVHVVDTTLRDGEQAPRVAFSAAERMELATMLAEAGIAEIEVGIPAMGEDEIEAIRGVVRLNLPTQLTCWTRAVESDILSAAACGTPFVHISFPTSRLQLELNGRDEDAQLEQVDRLVDIALREFDGVSVGALDGTRTDVDRLLAFGDAAWRAGARRLRIADTVGIGSPRAIRALFEQLRRTLPSIDLEFHGHNDLGLATANTLAAVEGGASAVSVTVGGLGERPETPHSRRWSSGSGCFTSSIRRSTFHFCGLFANGSPSARRGPFPAPSPSWGKMSSRTSRESTSPPC